MNVEKSHILKTVTGRKGGALAVNSAQALNNNESLLSNLHYLSSLWWTPPNKKKIFHGFNIGTR